MKRLLQTSLRRLWRQRLFTFLNVLGLAIGITACWVIYSILRFEYSFEKDLPGKTRSFRLVTGFVFDEKESYNGGVSAPMYQAIRQGVTGVKRVVPVFGRWINSLEIPREGSKPQVYEDPQGVVAIDSSYFEMIPYTWLSGNPHSALSAPESLVLTESRAKTYFGNSSSASLIGRTITYNDTLQKTITGIVKDLPYPSEFTGQEFFSLRPQQYSLNSWTNTNGSDKVYLELPDNKDSVRVLKQITAIGNRQNEEHQRVNKTNFKLTRWYKLLPLTESHFSTYIKEYKIRKASKPVLYGLIGLAAFILLLACINYINLSTAQVPLRAKEIGVRKTLGSNRRHLIGQVLTETMLTVVFSILLAYQLAQWSFLLLSDIIPAGAADYNGGIQTFLFLGALVLLITLLSGWYPAWLITKVQPVSIMRGDGLWKMGRQGLAPRKMLIVFQFVIAQIFITGALITGAQLRYTLKKDLGFNKDAVLLVSIPWKLQLDSLYNKRHFALADELRKDAGIRMVSLGREPMSTNYSSSMFEYKLEGKKDPVQRQVFRKTVDTNYLHLYELQLLAGRNLRPTDTATEFIINETAMRAYGFISPHDALGKIIGQPNSGFPIVGVVRDFHLQNFHNSIDPVALMSDKEELGMINIKLNNHDPAQWKSIVQRIEKQWYAFYPPGSFSYKFYDESVKAMYEQERNLSTLIMLATGIAILISCLGLFGLVTLTAFQRTKEIGIRKVLGASVTGIVKLLSADFVRLILIALLIASPIAWWATNKWLEDFVYRIQIQWWMFAVSGSAALAIALITISFRAIKAAKINPVDTLRSE